MGQDAGPRRGEWFWLWNAYVTGLCVAAIIAVILLDHRFPGDVPAACAALAGMAVCVSAFGRFMVPYPASHWRTVAYVGTFVGLWVIAVWASPVAVAAVPAIYPVLFARLPLAAALAVTTAVNLTPLTMLLISEGTGSPNLAMAIVITLIGALSAPVIGAVIVTSLRQRQRLTSLVAELASTRAESARLSRDAGAATERERLAREIHDTLAQGFTSIITLAQAVDAELDTDTAAARRHVELIRNTARENLVEARAMVAELTPTALQNVSLRAAIGRLCDRLSAETNISVTLRTADQLPSPSMATDVVLLRAAQEAFANIRKHAQARSVTVDLSAVGRTVRLSVADDGVGLTHDHGEGFGLRGMRARAAQVGGSMSVSPTEGGGTTVTVEVPA